MTIGRRIIARMAIGAAVLLVTRVAGAEATVPLGLQARLLSKVCAFDRNYAARAGNLARVLVVKKDKDADSARVAANVAKELAALADVGGVAANVEVDTFASPAALADRVRAQKVAVVYFATGLEGDLPEIAKALAGVDVLTAGASPTSAPAGAVVAFDLEEGRPKMVVNLPRAKSQNVSFKPELLKLARLVE